MEESATYQAIVRRGRTEEARRTLLFQGEAKFGPPDAATQAAIEALNDLPQLEELLLRLIRVGSWQELRPPHNPKRRNRKNRAGP
jgi:hypothetical protein